MTHTKITDQRYGATKMTDKKLIDLTFYEGLVRCNYTAYHAGMAQEDLHRCSYSKGAVIATYKKGSRVLKVEQPLTSVPVWELGKMYAELAKKRQAEKMDRWLKKAKYELAGLPFVASIEIEGRHIFITVTAEYGMKRLSREAQNQKILNGVDYRFLLVR